MIGNLDILEYFQNCGRNNSLAHAYALIGPSRSGRKELLKAFLGDFLSAKSLDHPDIRLISPLPEKDSVSIEQIRELKQWLAMSPLAAENKVAIVESAETMNEAGQNAFLKVLEEPVANTYIFLLLAHRRALLPTVYSRVVPLYFTAPPAAPAELSLLKEFLSAKDASERLRLWLSQGIEKEEIRDWLYRIIPELRQHLLVTRSSQLGKTIKDLLGCLAGPSGQNWQLIAENTIISI